MGMVQNQIKHHPNQVTNLHQLHPGLLVDAYDAAGLFSASMLILSNPYTSADNNWLIDGVNCSTGIVRTMSLADRGVVPYKDGRWNDKNHFVIINNGNEVKIMISFQYEDTDGQAQTPSRIMRLSGNEQFVQHLRR